MSRYIALIVASAFTFLGLGGCLINEVLFAVAPFLT